MRVDGGPPVLAGMQDAMDRIATIQRRFGTFSVAQTVGTPRTDPNAYAGRAPEANAAETNQVFAATLGTPQPVSGLDQLSGPGALDEVSADDVLAPVVSAPGPDVWRTSLPAEGQRWAGAIDAAATAAGVDPRLLAALVWQESSFRPDAVSPAGAIGLAQLMPGTAAALGVDPRDPVENLQGGARYLAEQLDRFGRTDLALAAYNAGPGRVTRAGGIPDIPETQAYVTRVLANLEHLGGSA